MACIAHGLSMTDKELSQVTGIPVPSVRRTRLHLVISGRIVATSKGYVAKKQWEKPDEYRGVQRLQ